MRVKSLLILSVVGSLCVNTPLDAGDQDARRPVKRDRPGPGKPGMTRGPGPGIDRLLRNPEMREKLGLTDDQMSAFRKKGQALRERQGSLTDKIREAAEAQAALLNAPELDKKAIMQAVKQIGRLRTQLAQLRIEHLFLVREVLTDEQLRTVKKTMRSRMNEHRRRIGEEGHARRDPDGKTQKSEGRKRDRRPSDERRKKQADRDKNKE